ncbi:MAG: DUF4058 family protein [Chloroflexota bacterium]
MAPIRSRINQYLGINAHLHSYWQLEGGWAGFHTNHIADLMRVLRAELLPMGYTAELEPSLQIRRLDNNIEEPESDVTIYDLDPNRGSTPSLYPEPAGAVLVLPAPDVLMKPALSEKEYSAVVIYELAQSQRSDKAPVVWIELLSPSNKGESQDGETYRQKRSKIVQSGLVFVEIDYRHESAPTFHGIADYRSRQRRISEPGSHPYRIAIIDPRPIFEEGRAYISEFDVDQPIPQMTLPLNGGDTLDFDFGIPYHKTFIETLYGLELVDYSQLPIRFERHSAAAQASIATRMVAILDAVQQDIELETGPFPIREMPQESALAEVGVLIDRLSR